MPEPQSAAVSDGPLLAVEGLSVSYAARRRFAGHASAFLAVDDVTFQIQPGETVALVGESGSGKSSIGNSIVGLAPVTRGRIALSGREIANAHHGVDRRVVSRQVQMVFQDPYGSLNPTRTIEQSLVEPMMVHRSMSSGDMRAAVRQILQDVGLSPEVARRYPAHFSGGQRQRIAVARALMIEPELIICDEALSALDLSVQAQVLNLLAELQQRHGVAYLFISHDLAVVSLLAQRTVVLYKGRVMETGNTREITTHPLHPYTRALLAAAPLPDPKRQRERRELRKDYVKTSADVADVAAQSPSACPFADRCPYVASICREQRPELRDFDGTLAACHRIGDIPDYTAAA